MTTRSSPMPLERQRSARAGLVDPDGGSHRSRLVCSDRPWFFTGECRMAWVRFGSKRRLAVAVDRTAAKSRSTEFVDRLACPAGLVGIIQNETRRLAEKPPLARRQAALRDGAAQLVHQVLPILLEDRRQIDLDQKVGTAPQIQAQVDLLVRNPARQVFRLLAPQQIWGGIDETGHDNQDHQDDLPARDIDHGGACSLEGDGPLDCQDLSPGGLLPPKRPPRMLFGLPAPGSLAALPAPPLPGAASVRLITSWMVWRIARTRTPSASSN